MSPWITAIRPKTLPASVSPILLGSALAYSHEGHDTLIFIVAMACAVSLQIGVNLANDFFDMLSGVDTNERLGPTRVTQSALLPLLSIFKASILFAAIALLLGLFLVWQSHWQLIWFGAFSLVAVFAYSGGPWPLASHGLGELTVFFFFGWLAVAGAYFVQVGQIPFNLLIYGSAVGCLSAAIMLVNNIRDRNTDLKAGKITLAVRLGNKLSRYLFVALLIAAFIAHYLAAKTTVNLWLMYFPIAICFIPAVFLCVRIFKRQGAELNRQLSQTALLLLVYCCSSSLVLL